MRKAELRRQIERAASNSKKLSERLDALLDNDSYRLPKEVREEVSRVSERLRIAASGAGVELRSETISLSPTKKWASIMVFAGGLVLGPLSAGLAEAAGEDIWAGIKSLAIESMTLQLLSLLLAGCTWVARAQSSWI